MLGGNISKIADACCTTALTITEDAVIVATIFIAGVVLLTVIEQRDKALLDRMNTNFPK